VSTLLYFIQILPYAPSSRRHYLIRSRAPLLALTIAGDMAFNPRMLDASLFAAASYLTNEKKVAVLLAAMHEMELGQVRIAFCVHVIHRFLYA
jgi:hypothetical protein